MTGSLMRNLCVLILLLAGLAGCATGSNPKDPWESVNRKVFVFNEKLDAWVLKPVAQGYDAVAPLPVRTGVSNVFSNVDDVWIGINNILQGKPVRGLSDWGRFLVNTTIGIFGVFDVATEFGLEKHEEDFGQTLAVWGVGDGPFLMLPFFGPKTLRDAGGLVFDTLASPYGEIPDIPVRNSTRGLKLISERADLLNAEKALDTAALDRYSYLRDFYINRRHSLIRDGKRDRSLDDDDNAYAPTRVNVLRSPVDSDVQIGMNSLALVRLDRFSDLHVQVPAASEDLLAASNNETL